MPSVFAVVSTEAGLILLEDDLPVASSRKSAAELAQKAKDLGATEVWTSDPAVAEGLRAGGLTALDMPAEKRAQFESAKVSLMVSARLVKDEAEALEKVRERSIQEAEQAIREASSKPDLHLVQAIQALDEGDKMLNITSTRASEWYGLHFPELTQMVQDNVALCKLIVEVGPREGYDEESLKGRGFSDKKVEAILTARDRSKGGEISDADMRRVKALAETALALSAEREKLSAYVEAAMNRIAPNVTHIAGATIGARLMAKAGGLERLATLPASTIQVLGAEKALFRALKTGSRPPKHGILFQHNEVHLAPRWQRGKIARTIANKVAIAARVDCYRGGVTEPALVPQLDRRLVQIKEKYKDAPPERRFEKPRFEGPRGRDRRRQKHGRR